jgi:hypothetical protein
MIVGVEYCSGRTVLLERADDLGRQLLGDLVLDELM